MLALIHRHRYLHTSAHVNPPKLVSLDQGGMNEPASSAGGSLSTAGTAGIRALQERRTVLGSLTRSTQTGFYECSSFTRDEQKSICGPLSWCNFRDY